MFFRKFLISLKGFFGMRNKYVEGFDEIKLAVDQIKPMIDHLNNGIKILSEKQGENDLEILTLNSENVKIISGVGEARSLISELSKLVRK